MKKMMYGGLLSVFLMGNSIMAMHIENSASGIKAVLSEVQSLRNGALRKAVQTKVLTIVEDTTLNPNFKVVLLDALDRTVSVNSPQSSLLILQKIKDIVGETAFDSDQGYGICLWDWMYDVTNKDIKEAKFDLDIIRSMISKLNGTSSFEAIKPILVRKGLGYYIPPSSKPLEQFQWHK